MITKGIIKSIDYNGNTCTVRVPFFETANNDEIISTAPISNTPGSYNGYKVDDVVWVAFEDGSMDNPVVIGKLYLGVEAEKADPRGTLNVVDSKVSNSAEIPFDTKLGSNVADNVANTNVPFSSLEQVANSLSTAEVNIAQNDRDYGNRFKQVISDTDGKFSKIEQDIDGFKLAVGNKHEEIDGTLSNHNSRINANADSISQEVTARTEAINGVVNDYTSKIEQTAENITAEVADTYVSQDGKSSTEAFGWSLKKEGWNVYKKVNEKETNILEVSESGLTVTGAIEAESGHIGSFTIGEELNDHSGIYSDGYKDKNNNNIASFKNNNKDWEFDNTAKGVYVGTDGIRLGKNFSVDNEGNVIASSLKISATKSVSEAINEAAGAAQSAAEQKASELADSAQAAAEDTAAAALSTAQTTLSGQISDAEKNAREDAIADIVGRGYQDSTGVVNIIDGTITADYLAAKGIYTNQLEIYSEDGDPILLANVDDDKRVQIGGFEVNKDALNSGEVDGEQITLSTTGISLGTIDSEGNYPFMVACNGDISASKGSFTGSITATDASLTNINELSMADGAPANFDELTTRGNTSVGGRINSSNGYFFGAGTDCGFTLADATTKDQTVTFSITATCNLVGGGTNYRYSIRVTASAPLVASQTISHSAAVWGSGLNSVTIPAGDIIIAAGSTTGTTSRTVPNNDRFSDLKYTLDRIEMYGTEPSTYASTSNATNLTTSPRITSASSIAQKITTNTGNITLTCNTLKVDGTAVQFKVGGGYYTPTVKLDVTGSPNCFWATTITIDSDSWASVTLPAALQGASSAYKNKVVAVTVTANQSYSATTTIRPDLSSIVTALNSSNKTKDVLSETDELNLQYGAEAGRIANCWYVDYSVNHDKIWVYNGQNSSKTLNVIVAGLI